ncbi:response regulator [Bacteriovorax sp. Seq25_V]|uniref:response regulator n=1 Tax=Bacteriovorax sp. Seq25_V TaxID=1201288 RepID=UPI00038A2B20|nr:response regulator [Bacteriovorax sp. Seq25_V]EQC43813.1 response regulator receiver domain protein [Bacteriovorax sp. Seq25_V]
MNSLEKKILIVDDEKSVQFLYEKVFKKEVQANQFKIVFCISGEEAIAQLKSEAANDFKLIISDINMPGISGFELLREVKSLMPDLPVFMSSAYTDTERQSLAKDLGADDYITKPVDFTALKEKISQLLS